jgi:hypothetical protein
LYFDFRCSIFVRIQNRYFMRTITQLFIALLFLVASNQAFSQGQVTTSPPLSTNNGQGGITFNVSTNTAVVVDTIWCAFYGATATVSVWYTQTAINGAPTVNSANGWVLAGSATVQPINTSSSGAQIQQIPIDLNIPMSAGDVYGFWVGNNNGTGVGYTTYVTTNQYVFTDGTVTVNNGPNVGYGGNAPNPTFSTRQFNGRVVYSIPVINAFPYCEGFENGDGEYVAGGTSSTWEWGVPNNTAISAANSGDNAWVTNLDGDHNNSELSYVRSPRIDLTSLVDPAIKFYANYELQNNTDGVAFQVSQDSGYTWTTLGSSSSTPPWFNANSITALGNNLGNGNGWTGQSSGWTMVKHSLNQFANDTAFFFRWFLASNASTVNEGYGFDDIVVAESNDVSLVEVFYEDSVCGSTNHAISAVLCNMSIEDRYGFDVVIDTNGSQVTYSYPDTLPVCGCDTVEVLTFNSAQGGYWDFTVEVDNTGDVNAANDTASGDILAYAIPGGSIVSGGGTYCQGEVIQLTFNFSGQGPWNCQYSNGTTTFTAGNVSSPYTALTTTGGLYHIVSLSDATGCAGDSGTFGGYTNVTVNPNPTPNLGPDTTVCGSYVLDAGPGSSYAWSTGATTQTLVVTSPGLYAVTVTDANGCVGSDQADLDVNPLPVITINDTVLCEGGTFLFNAGGPFQSYLWDDGSTGQVRVVNSISTVSVTVTDFNGCSNSKTASITEEVPNPQPNISGGEGLAPVVLNAGAGYLAYYWNTGQQTQYLNAYAAGTYTCTVTDHNGCKGSDLAKVKIWPTSVEELVAAEGVAAFPNPVIDRFELRFGEDVDVPSTVSLIDVQGRTVMSYALDRGSRTHALVLPSHISAGSYVLRVPMNARVADIPLVVASR